MTTSHSQNSLKWSYLAFLALIAAAPPVSTDMYLAAIPAIAKFWNTSENIVSLSLVLWFVGFSVFLLIYGPLSDRYGRKPILMSGMVLFVISSFLCSMAADVWHLITFRVMQGIGAAAPSSMCMAICRDRFEAEQRKIALAYLGVIMAVAPMVSPLIGAFLLKFGNWRWIFIVQGIISLVTFIACFQYQETLQEKSTGHLFAFFSRFRVLLRNRNFMLVNLSMGVITGPFYGYLAFSSIVYIRIFHLSEQYFSVLFAINAAISMMGSYCCTRLTRVVSDKRLITYCLSGCILGGLGIFISGSAHYLFFAVWMALFTFSCTMSRPLSNNIILEQVDHDIGLASSMIVFYQFLVGALCMNISTVEWKHPVRNFGLLMFSIPLAVIIIWPSLARRLWKTAA